MDSNAQSAQSSKIGSGLQPRDDQENCTEDFQIKSLNINLPDCHEKQGQHKARKSSKENMTARFELSEKIQHFNKSRNNSPQDEPQPQPQPQILKQTKPVRQKSNTSITRISSNSSVTRKSSKVSFQKTLRDSPPKKRLASRKEKDAEKKNPSSLFAKKSARNSQKSDVSNEPQLKVQKIVPQMIEVREQNSESFEPSSIQIPAPSLQYPSTQ